VVGLLFASLQTIFPLGGFYMLVIVYFLGSFAGNIIFKISGRKLGRKVATIVTLGLLIGTLCLTPISLSLIIFILGTISPFLGWGNPFAGFFRR
jgi:hypothetical protein